MGEAEAKRMTEVKIIAGPKSWIEGEAVRQLENTAQLPGVVAAWGLPGLHPSQGCPVDAVFLTHGRIYPHLVGSDIGCGMALWRTSIKPRQPERIAKKLTRGARLEHGVDDPLSYLEKAGVKPCGFESSLGTVGRGNHFAEILTFAEIRDEWRASTMLGGSNSFLLVHSGSRGYGEKILHEHTATHQGRGIPTEGETEVWNAYWQSHNHAVDWASVNRDVIASRIFEKLGATGEKITESVHNYVEPLLSNVEQVQFIHRKGAIPANTTPIVIPGSRGSHTYVVEAIDGCSESGWSVSHGAGRKMSRKDARVKFTIENPSMKSLERTKFGSVVICEDRVLLMEEAPEAYKPIDRVIQDLVDHGLVKVIALLKPVVTYKYSRGAEE